MHHCMNAQIKAHYNQRWPTTIQLTTSGCTALPQRQGSPQRTEQGRADLRMAVGDELRTLEEVSEWLSHFLEVGRAQVNLSGLSLDGQHYAALWLDVSDVGQAERNG